MREPQNLHSMRVTARRTRVCCVAEFAGRVVQDADESKLLVLAAHCPAVLQRRTWSVQQFTLEKLLYVGHNSRVLRAIDKVTGTTVALKVYKKQQLGDMERCALLPTHRNSQPTPIRETNVPFSRAFRPI